jgi:hypothetical protein
LTKKINIDKNRIHNKLLEVLKSKDFKIPEQSHNEVTYTQNTLVKIIKNHFREEEKSGLVIKGPKNPNQLRSIFFNGENYADITFSYSGQKFIAVEIKLLKKKQNRNQALSTAIGQGIVYSMGKYKNSIIVIIDQDRRVKMVDLVGLKSKLHKVNVELIYFNYSDKKKYLNYVDIK